MAKPKAKPLGLKWRSSTVFIVGTVAISLFTDLFLYGLVVPILPFILQDRIHLPENQIQSHVSGLLAAYAAASVIFSPLAGIIADKVSARQLPFLAGLTALLIATVILSLGKTVAVLAIARVLQGISAAFVWTVGLTLVLDTVGPDNLGKTVGSIFGFISIGELAAPVLGGVLYKKAGNFGVFGLAFGLLALDLILRVLLIEKKTAAVYGNNDGISHRENIPQDENNQEDRPDENEQAPLLGTKEEDTYYQIAPDQHKLIKVFPIAYCLQDPRLLTALSQTLVQSSLLATFDATIPTEAHDLYDFDSLKAGLLFIPLVLPYLLLGPIAGWAVDRYGPKPTATIGFSYLVPVLTLLRLVRGGGSSEVIRYGVLLAFCGLGLALISSSPAVEAAHVVQRYHNANPGFFGDNGPYAQLYGMNSMIFSLGMTLGPLVSGALRESIGYGNMNLVVAGCCFIVAILSFIYTGGKPRLLGKKSGHNL